MSLSSSQLHIHISAQDRPGILAESLTFIVRNWLECGRYQAIRFQWIAQSFHSP